MRLNNHNLSDFLKQTFFLGILEQLLLETPEYWGRYSFLRNVYKVFIIAIFSIPFFRGLVQHIGNNSQSETHTFVALKNHTMFNISLTKLNKTLRKLYHLFVKIMQKGANQLKAQITRFITFDASSCLPYFFRTLDNSYSLNILNS